MKTIDVKFVAEKLNKTVETVKESTLKLNDTALKTTEKTVLNAFDKAGEWQKVSNKAIKKGLEFTATQQDMIFDSLESVKSQILKGFKRTKLLFSKN